MRNDEVEITPELLAKNGECAEALPPPRAGSFGDRARGVSPAFFLPFVLSEPCAFLRFANPEMLSGLSMPDSGTSAAKSWGLFFFSSEEPSSAWEVAVLGEGRVGGRPWGTNGWRALMVGESRDGADALLGVY